MERQVIVAKSAGFCFGVERAVAQGPIYTYGPIIHNEEVVRDLEEKDVQVLDTEEDLENLPEGQGTVIIRSHGVSRHVYDILNSRGVNVVDATCPFVKKIHKIVDEHSRAGEAVIIIRRWKVSGAGAMVTLLLWKMRLMQKIITFQRAKSYVSYPRRHLITTNFKN